MNLDLELYRKEILVSLQPYLRISAIDISPEHPLRTLLFLHGFGGQASQWKFQLQHFSQENRVIALDLRGHGRSSAPAAGYSIVEIVNDIDRALDGLNVSGPCVVIGHSFGGAVASEFAALHPQRVERLVLIASAGEFRLNPFYRFALGLPASLIRLLGPLARRQLGAPLPVLRSWYQNTVSQWNGWSLFRSLNLPVLVIRGYHDLVLEKPAFEKVARSIPNAEEVDVGSSGHMVMLERRAAVNRALDRFLDEKPRSWREDASWQQASGRAALKLERPWLTNYDDGVPFTIAIPRVPLPRLLVSAARRYPLNPALSFAGRRMTYLRLNQEVNQFAHALLRQGLEKGERVLLLLPNLPQAVIAFLGVLKAGGVAVFTLPGTSPQELARLALDCGARTLVALTQQRDLARQVMRQTRQSLPASDLPTEAGIAAPYQIIFADPTEYISPLKRLLLRRQARDAQTEPESWLETEEYLFRPLLQGQSRDEPEVEMDAESLAVIAYTGGTTSDSKGVMLSHRNLVANALQTRAWLPEGGEGKERFLSVLPFSHSYGLTTALTTPIAMAAMLILKPRFEPLDLLKTIQNERPTIFPGVPGMYMALSDFPGVRKYGISSIRACLSGSAPLPVEVQESFEKLTRGRLVEGYGLTEASPVTHANPLSDVRKLGSIGLPLPSTEARVMDLVKGQKEVPPGQIGELAVRGPQVMMGYWQNPEATRRVLSPDGWLLTGDVAQMDAEGYFRIIARKAEMWYPQRAQGETASGPAFPRDVEEVLYEIPQIKEAAVVAIARQPIAFIIVRGKERLTSETVTAYVRRRLPPELTPRLVIFVEEFPRSFIGKVLRRELAKRVELSG